MSQSTESGFCTTIVENELKLSPAAITQLGGLIKNADDSIEGIRIYVTGGGCSGMTYGMTYAEQIGDRDKVLDNDGVKVVVDAIALSYLKGCDIDYVEDGLNASFVFNNVFKSVGGSGSCGGCGGH